MNAWGIIIARPKKWRTLMGRLDRLLIATIRFLLASALIGACLLCEAALWLGYVDWWVGKLLQ